ncbi:MAG: EAL domain-containing protein [Pseudomonadota bacterium]
MSRLYGQGLSPYLRPWFNAADRWAQLSENADREDRVRTRAIFILGSAFIPLAIILPMLTMMAGLASAFSVTTAYISVIGMVAALILLRKSDSPTRAGIVFSAATTFGLTLWPGLVQGVFAPTHYLLALTPLLWGLMVNARACIGYTMVLLLFTAGMTIFGPGAVIPAAGASISSQTYQGLLLISAIFACGACTAGYALMTNFVLGELQIETGRSNALVAEANDAREAAFLASERFQTFADIASDWLWEANEKGDVIYFGGRGANELKRPMQDFIGRHFLTYLDFRKDDIALLKTAVSRLQAYCDIPVRYVDLDGTQYIFELSATPVRNAEGKVTGYLGIGKDVTARVRAENDVRFLAANDKLTGLSNRHTFNMRINDELSPENETGSVLFAIDLDDFKSVNDSYGHHIGDALLVEVAARINSCIRKGDWAARLGGDEFVVMAVNYDPDKWGIDLLADRLLQALALPYKIEELELHMSASIGVARYPVDAESARELTHHADLALYAAKQGGRNQWRLFNPSMQQVAHQRKLMETGLRAAIDKGEVEVWYQPLINLESKRTSGFEALARWTDGERGAVPPPIFIDVAEKCGLIGQLGTYVLHRACSDAVAWAPNDDGDAPRVSVNISPVQFSDGSLPEVVSTVLSETGLAPSRLELEITESILMEDIDNAIRMLEALERLGVSIAIDDFGTGYSSLSYLKRFPLSRLKVDRSFIHDLESDENDRTITKTVVQLGENLGLKVIAEGVETDGQRAWLESMGCEEVQGYLYAKPMPSNQIEDYLENPVVLLDALPKTQKRA